MSEESFPSFFFSKAPLPEKVDLINLKHGKDEKFYWMLSINNNEPHKTTHRLGNSALAPYEDNEADMLDCNDLEDDYEINPTKSGKFITSFYVPNALHSVIIGPRGSKLRELQDSTNTLIKIPKRQEDPIIKITGHSERSVASARTQITLLCLSRREKLPITHFISIPMYSQSIRDSFNRFKEDILGGPSTRGIDESIFQKAEKLHLTIVTLALLDDKEIEETKQLLSQSQSHIQKIFSARKPTIVMKGVEIMNDDPTEVDVLYGKVSLERKEDAENLQKAADEIFEIFYRNGLVRKQYERVKLHVTLLNSRYRKSDESKNTRNDKRESFDATYILDKFQDFYFGKTVLDKIYLSIRFTSGENGYYQSASNITI